MPNYEESIKREKEIRETAANNRSVWSKWLTESRNYAERDRLPESISELPELRMGFTGEQKAQFHIKIPQEAREHRDAFVFHFLCAAIQSVREIYPNIAVGRTNSCVHFSKEIEGRHAFAVLDVANDGNLLVVNVRFIPLLIHDGQGENSKIQFSRRYKSFILVAVKTFFKQIPDSIGMCIAGGFGCILLNGFLQALFPEFPAFRGVPAPTALAASLFLCIACYCLLVHPVRLANKAQAEAKNFFDFETSSLNRQELDFLEQSCFRAEPENADKALQSYAMRLYLTQVCDAVKLICARFA